MTLLTSWLFSFRTGSKRNCSNNSTQFFLNNLIVAYTSGTVMKHQHCIFRKTRPARHTKQDCFFSLKFCLDKRFKKITNLLKKNSSSVNHVLMYCITLHLSLNICFQATSENLVWGIQLGSITRPLLGKGGCTPFSWRNYTRHQRAAQIEPRMVLDSHTNGRSLCGRIHAKETQVGGRLLLTRKIKHTN